MKITTALTILVGMALGFGLGRVTRTPPPEIQPACPSPEIQSTPPAPQETAGDRLKIDRYDWLIKQWIETDSQAFYSLTTPRQHFAPKKEMAWFLGLNEKTIEALSELSDQTMVKVKEWETANVVYQEKSKERISYELPALPMHYKEEFLTATEAILTHEQSEALAPTFSDCFRPMLLKRFFDAELIPPDGSILIEGPEGIIHKSASYDTRKRLQLKTWNIREDGHESGVSTTAVTVDMTADEKPWIAGRWGHLIFLERP
ncbi:hypothetical protein P4C99_11970 [Pontiellaceae bacterium B1224]|nr:hypothetical protein [Pontiellaceae bacterium B1224]